VKKTTKLARAPEPYTLDDVEEKFWKDEPGDELVPVGWLSDFVLSLRGIETPTVFALWSGLYTLSVVLKRDSYWRWVPDPLVPNLYIILVGAPKTGKSTATNFGDRIAKLSEGYYIDPWVSARKRLNIFRGKVTPESFTLALQPREEIVTIGDRRRKYESGSEVALYISELASLLGKQNYNEGLVTRLTDLYDCKVRDNELTIKRGPLEFKNIYVTLIGATTPTSLQDSIPEAAFGEGFMSRVILVDIPARTRSYDMPRRVEGAADDEELAKRLAWVGEKSIGEYDFTPEARLAYKRWYDVFDKILRKKAGERHSEMLNRYDIHLLKLSLLIRAQRYREGTDVTLEDFEEARKILEHTFNSSEKALDNVGIPQYTQMYNRISKYLEEHKGKTRRQLLTTFAKYGINSDWLDKILTHLVQEGKIEVLLDREKKESISHHGREKYFWE
jgi:hypothetical protein